MFARTSAHQNPSMGEINQAPRLHRMRRTKMKKKISKQKKDQTVIRNRLSEMNIHAGIIMITWIYQNVSKIIYFFELARFLCEVISFRQDRAEP